VKRPKDGGRSFGTGFARIPPNNGLGCQRDLEDGAYPSVNPTVRAGVNTANPGISQDHEKMDGPPCTLFVLSHISPTIVLVSTPTPASSPTGNQ
jgi:hypothetical protein